MKKKLLNRFVWDNRRRLERMLDDIIDVQPEMIVLSNRVRAHRIMVDILAMYERIKELEAENHNLQNEILLKPLEHLPSASTEKTGRWEKHSYFKDAYICSVCNTGGNIVYKDFKYCPNCGAKMEV